MARITYIQITMQHNDFTYNATKQCTCLAGCGMQKNLCYTALYYYYFQFSDLNIHFPSPIKFPFKLFCCPTFLLFVLIATPLIGLDNRGSTALMICPNMTLVVEWYVICTKRNSYL